MLKIGTAQISNRKAPSASLTGASELLITGFTDFVTPIPLYNFFIYDRECTAKPSFPPMRQVFVLQVTSAEEPRTLNDGGSGRHPSFAVSLSPMGGKRLFGTHLARLKSRLSCFSRRQNHPALSHPPHLSPSPSLEFHDQLYFQNSDHSLLMLSESWRSCPRDSKTHETNTTTSSSKQLGEIFARQHQPLLSTS